MARDLRAAIRRDGINAWATCRFAAKVCMGGGDALWGIRVGLPAV
jgi:hypothetical protein